MATDMGMINDFIQKEEQVKEDLFSSTKHHCIFEINKETGDYKFVDDYGEDYDAADDMCQSMNNFRTPDMPVYFCVRCLEQEEFEHIENYSPFLTTIVVTKTMED